MFSRRSDLPLDGDVLGRFLPWIIAFMAYLAILATAALFVLDATAGRWSAGITRTLTVEVPPPADDAASVPAGQDPRVNEVLKVLRTTDGVTRADVVPEAQMLNLLKPWLGSFDSTAELPLPRLVDVAVASGADFDLDALRTRLAAAAPGTTVDDHRVWMDRLVRLVEAVQALGAAILVLIAMATAGTVVYTTRTGLAVHREAIEVLHLIGAQDSYVARQFASRALVLGLRGGIIGLVLAVPTLFAIGTLASRLDSGMLPDVSLGVAHWVGLAVIPLLVAAVAMLTARFTVTRTLAAMP